MTSNYQHETECFHCGLEIPNATHLSIKLDHEEHLACCLGCQAVAQTIIDNGLGDYYRHRTEKSPKGEMVLPNELKQLEIYDNQAIQQSFVIQNEQSREAVLILEGITCAACIWLNEKHLKQLKGVYQVHVNYSTHRARISWNDAEIKLSQILYEIQKLGYKAHPYSAEKQANLRKTQRKVELRRLGLGGLCAAQVMMFAVALYAGDYYHMDLGTRELLRYFSLILTIPVVTYVAIPFYKSAYKAIQSGNLNMDVPISASIILAFLGSVWVTLTSTTGTVYFDGVTMFVLFVLSAKFIERGAQERSVEASENLLKLAPTMANRLKSKDQLNDFDVVPVAELQEFQYILVKAGEPIAADGLIIQGKSTVDEALLTGESRPVLKEEGSKVITGSLNLESPIVIQVTETGERTVLAGIVRLLDKAQSEKPKLAELADRIAGKFTIFILLLSISSAIGWYYVDSSRIFEIILATLVVTCPCALSLAAPAAFAAATSRLLREGILLTRGNALESLAKVKTICFDKTGTLSFAKPIIKQIKILNQNYSEHDALRMASSLEQASEHPLAESFLNQIASNELYPVDSIENFTGKGLIGQIYLNSNLKKLSIGRPEFISIESNLIENIQNSMPEDATLVWLCDLEIQQPIAVFAISDQLRPEASQLIEKLQKDHFDLHMLTGDHPIVANFVGMQLNLNSNAVHANLSPQDKLNFIKKIQEKNQQVAMIGDGINDAPVLAGADISMAMGRGTQVARSSSDIILMREQLLDIYKAIQISQKTMQIIHQNFIWSIIYNLVAIPFAVLGYLPPWLASLGMSFSSLIVVLNAVRLKNLEI